MRYGGIEAGGTKWVCAISEGNGRLLDCITIPTSTPEETIALSARFFLDRGLPSAVGLGCFGPLDLRPDSATFGRLTTTPKHGWRQTDILGSLCQALRVPVAIDTDVNAAALGEWRWGAGMGLDVVSYLTVGTGIGGGTVVAGAPLHGLLHPEFGHVRIPHDWDEDPFPGTCPYHGDCFEGLASGEAMRARWGLRSEEISSEAAWQLEAEYISHGIVNLIHALSPERVIVGGGVMAQPRLLSLMRARVLALMAGYLDVGALRDERAICGYIVPPALGEQAGVLGAIELARRLVDVRAPETAASLI